MANTRVTELAKFRQQMLENAGGLGVEFALSWTDTDGNSHSEVFLVPHPMSADDEQDAAIEKASGGIELAKAILNTPNDDKVYDRFAQAGGRSKDVAMAWNAMMSEMQKNGFALPK